MNSGRKKAIIIVSSLLLAAALLSMLYFVDFEAVWKFLSGGNDGNGTSKDPVIEFFPKDFESNILEDPEYLGENRYLNYTVGAETFMITDGNYAQYGSFCEFFGKYFGALISGDADALNALYSDEYIAENGLQTAFPMQRVYGMHATLMFEDIPEDGAYRDCTRQFYMVNYMIQYNDGSIRRDVGSNQSRPLLFELIENGDGEILLIGKRSYYDN